MQRPSSPQLPTQFRHPHSFRCPRHNRSCLAGGNPNKSVCSFYPRPRALHKGLQGGMFFFCEGVARAFFLRKGVARCVLVFERFKHCKLQHSLVLECVKCCKLNLGATGWDESSIMDRTGDTGRKQTDHIRPEGQAAQPSLPTSRTTLLKKHPPRYPQNHARSPQNSPTSPQDPQHAPKTPKIPPRSPKST